MMTLDLVRYTAVRGQHVFVGYVLAGGNIDVPN